MKVYFKIGYSNTEENRQVHHAFMSYCEHETDNNYLQGMKRLLEWYSTDWKYNTILTELKSVKEELTLFKQEMSEKENSEKPIKEVTTFGKNKTKEKLEELKDE